LAVAHIDRLITDLEESGLKETVSIRLGMITLEFSTDIKRGCKIVPLDSAGPLAGVADQFAQRGFSVMEVEPFKPLSNWCSQQTAYTYTIDPKGDLYACYDALVYPVHKIGSVLDNGEAKYNAQYYRWYSRDPFAVSICRECKMLPICLGGCAFDSWLKHEVFDAPGCVEGFEELVGRSVKRQVKYGMMDEKAKLRY
jgi:radical SAM protein with 4Fe4S-binding SPASM domain